MQSKNVLQFMNYSAPYRGNFIQSLLCLEEHLLKENTALVYLFLADTAKTDWAQQLIRDGKKVYFLPGGQLKDLLFINRLIKKHDIGIIHTHFIGVATIFSLRLINRFGQKIRVFRHLHNPYELNRPVVEYLKKTVAHVDLSIGCSKAVADDYAMKKKDRREKVVYATNAIEFSRLDKYEPMERSAMGIKPGDFVLLVFGFDYHRKGIDILINAAAELVKENTPLCLLISLANNRAVAENEIKKQFGEIPSWIKLAPPRNDIATYYRFADAFISSSRSEGFCYSLVEAAYCGTQVMASEIFAQKDLNIPFTFRYPVEDIAELKKQILLAMAVSKEERSRRSVIQKEYAVGTFDLNKWAATVIGFYKEYR